MTAGADIWERASLALRCLAADPEGLGGMVIRARCGPARDALIQALDLLPDPPRRIHPDIGDDQLFGSVDIAGTLAAGRRIQTRGILADPATLVMAMAERASAHLAARLAQHLDQAKKGCLILLDEGADPDETSPPALTERLAFHVDLDGLSTHDIKTVASAPSLPIGNIAVPDRALQELTAVAARLGIDSLRAPLLALRCARAHAALSGRETIEAEDLTTAAALVYPHRATMLPETTDADQQPESSPEPQTETSEGDSQPGPDQLPAGEMLIEAVRAVLPADLLERMATPKTTRGAKGNSGAGARRKGNRRGRPLPPRPGRLDGRARIDLVATLRAAAPWQPLRRQQRPEAPGLLIRASDIRLKRFEERSDRLLIFTVDASGSAAVTRLNEAKGAVELLLGEAYARRDHVALISFRGKVADLLLPPTRSLVQTKRRLASLPGGGGTPLAAALKEAGALATVSRSKGLSPTVVVMTDGRANITLDGVADRPRAASDSETMAGALRQQGIPGLMIDMSNRPQPALKTLADALDAPYVPLPRADARKVSSAVNVALDGKA